jgi:hypothetical protein
MSHPGASTQAKLMRRGAREATDVLRDRQEMVPRLDRSVLRDARTMLSHRNTDSLALPLRGQAPPTRSDSEGV